MAKRFFVSPQQGGQSWVVQAEHSDQNMQNLKTGMRLSKKARKSPRKSMASFPFRMRMEELKTR
jgi:hypothetical protein